MLQRMDFKSLDDCELMQNALSEQQNKVLGKPIQIFFQKNPSLPPHLFAKKKEKKHFNNYWNLDQ
jgi:hypothetical protein